MQEMQENIIKI